MDWLIGLGLLGDNISRLGSYEDIGIIKNNIKGTNLALEDINQVLRQIAKAKGINIETEEDIRKRNAEILKAAEEELRKDEEELRKEMKNNNSDESMYRCLIWGMIMVVIITALMASLGLTY